MVIMNSICPARLSWGVIPVDSPVVPKADTVSKNRLRKSMSSVKSKGQGDREDQDHAQGCYRERPVHLEVGDLPAEGLGLGPAP